MSYEMKRTIHTLVFRDGDIFVASGVELDIFAQGKSEQEALDRLDIVLRAEIREANATGRDLFDIGPAPESVRELYKSRNSKVVSRNERLVA